VSERVELRDFYLFGPKNDYKLSFFRCLSAMGREAFWVYCAMHVVCVCSSSTWERNLCVKCGQVLAAAWGCLGRREYVCEGAFTFAAGDARPAYVVGEIWERWVAVDC
jgi:hypothetical protein